MAKSLPPVSAKVIADAEQFIAEFRRADNAARRATARIDGEVDRLAKSLKKKFSGEELGKGLLQGLGVGSGFAVAQQAASALTDFFRQQAEHAKSMEESTARQLDLTKQIHALRWTPDQKFAALEKDVAEKWKALQAAKDAGLFTTTTLGANYQVISTTGRRPLTNEEEATVALRTEEHQRAVLEKEKALIEREADATSSQAAQLTSDQARRIASLTEGVKLQKDAFDELLETQRKANAVTEETREKNQQLAEKYRSMADPLRDYRVQLEEIERVRGMLSAQEYMGATGAVRGRMVDAALEDFFGDMDRNSRLFSGVERLEGAARDMGWAFSSAFEDAVLGAGELRDVVNGLLQDVARIALRSAVTQPLGNWAGGLFSGIFGGGKAAGGPVDAGTTYLVGERGPELFTPDREGLIVPNDRLTAGTVRGDSFTFNYSIGAGVTQQQLMPVLAMMKRDIVATIADAKRRRLPVGATL